MEKFQTESPLATYSGSNVGSMYHGAPRHGHNKIKLESVEIVPQATLAANGTNYRTISIYAEDGTTVIASVDSSATAFTAGVRRAVTFGANGVGSNLEFDTDSVVKSTDTVAGTGGTLAYTLIYKWASLR